MRLPVIWVGLTASVVLGCASEEASVAIAPILVTEEAILTEPAASRLPFDQLGYYGGVSLNADATWAAAGLPGDSNAGGWDAGAVVLFTRTGSAWAFSSLVLAPDPENTDQFGHCVGLDGTATRMIVGVSGDYVGGVRTGSARVFVRSGTTWSQEQALLPVGGGAEDRIGAAVAISSDGLHALVGSYWSDPPVGINGGHTRAYVRSGTTWTEEALLYDLTGSADAWFGWSVGLSADGSRAIITEPNTWRAHIYTRSSAGAWALEQTLPTPSGMREFGRCGAIDATGERVVVGAWYAPPNERGAAFVFRRTGSTWTQEATLLPAAAADFDHVGTSCSISADGLRIAVGAPGDTVGSAPDVGSIAMFLRSGTTWTEEPTFYHSAPEADDRLGYSVDVSEDGTRAIAGAFGDDMYAGSGRVFTLRGEIGESCSHAGQCASGFCVAGRCCADAVCAPDAGSDAGRDAGSDAGTDAGSDAGTDAGRDAGSDAGSDAGTDAGRDAGSDAGSDAGTDAGRDAGSDAGSDAGTDAGRDAGSDAGSDAGRDAGSDAGRDAGTDAGTDAGFDAGRDAGSDTGRDLSDAGRDAGSDAGRDLSDAGRDAGSDTGRDLSDAGRDAGSDTGRDLSDAGRDARSFDASISGDASATPDAWRDASLDASMANDDAGPDGGNEDDAGPGETDAGTTDGGSADASRDARSDTGGVDAGSSGGADAGGGGFSGGSCGCRAQGRTSVPIPLMLLSVAALGIRRRRRG